MSVQSVRITLADPILTAHEVADMLRLTYHSILTMRSRGDGPRYSQVRSKSRCMYRLSDVEAWLENNRVG